MKRMTSLSLAVAFALASQPALALGLGNIQVRSALGQPLRAVIPVEVSKPGESKLLQVTLASPQAYERAGISLAQLATSLQFTVAKNAQGKPVIRVSTTHPVRAPYLDFLLEVNSPSGSILREYTVLLDPPGFSQATRTPQHGMVSSKPVTSPGKPSNTVTTPMPMTNTAGGSNVSTPARPTVSRSAGTYGPVQAGATLSVIAQAIRPHGASNDQMMLALLAANPHAFIHDNINELKRGAILRIPGQSEINRNSLAKARAEVYRQMRQWRSRRTQAPTLVARVGGSSSATPAGEQAVPSNNRLRLIPPAGKGGSAHSRPGIAGGTGNAGIAGLKEDLARAKESLKSQQLHNADLSSRLSQLEKIQKENGKLLVMKNNEIAELQGKLTALRAASQAAVVAAHTKPATAKSRTTLVTAASVSAKAKATIPAAASTLVATTASSPVPVSSSKSVGSTAIHKSTPPTITKPVPVKTSTPWYRQIYVLIGGAVILLGVLIGLLLRGRRNQPAIEPASSLADQFGESGLDGSDTESSDEQSEAADTDEDEDPEVAALHSELAKNPEDPGLYLELASLYYARQDNDHFEEVAEAMHAQVSTDTVEWKAVATMGEEMLPQHPLFSRLVPSDEENEDGSTDIEAVIQPGLAPEEADDGFPDDTFELPSGDVPPPSFDSSSPIAEPADSLNSDWVAQEDTEAPPDSQDDQETMTGTQDPDQSSYDEGLVSSDPVETKLDLARAYLDMGDQEGARSMLKEVLADGNDVQKEEAQRLLEELH